ncbi:MAG: hypothetical protein JWR35_2467 [Marmoricola sp.]|nr:hypothetical protein [Marmoricola sp.]
MTDFEQTRETLNSQLDEARAADPLKALGAIGAVQTDISRHQREAVRAAVQQHSWTEIGAALGVSKQAAHQKFGKEWAENLKAELKDDVHAMKSARRRGDAATAAEAKAKLETVIAEFKGVRRNSRG